MGAKSGHFCLFSYYFGVFPPDLWMKYRIFILIVDISANLENIDSDIDKVILKILISISISIRLFWKISISISISIRQFWKILISVSISIERLWEISISISIRGSSKYWYDNGAKWVQNLIILACFQPILVFFPLICGWNIEYLYWLSIYRQILKISISIPIPIRPF